MDTRRAPHRARLPKTPPGTEQSAAPHPARAQQRDPFGLTTLEGDVACGPPWDASRARTQETRTSGPSHTPRHTRSITVLTCTTSANTPNTQKSMGTRRAPHRARLPKTPPGTEQSAAPHPARAQQRDPFGLTTLEGDVACGPPWDASRARTQETRTSGPSHTPRHTRSNLMEPLSGPGYAL